MTLTRWLAVVLLVSVPSTVASVATAAGASVAEAAVHADSPKKGAPKKKAKTGKKPAHTAPKKSAKTSKKKAPAKKPKHKSETESTPGK